MAANNNTGSERVKVKGLRQIEQEERRKRMVLWGLIGFIIAALATVGIIAAVKSNTSKNSDKATENLTPKNITSEGSFQVLKNGSVNASNTTTTSSGKRLQVVFDPMCPGCGAFDRETHSTLLSKVKNGSVDLRLSPVAFLDRSSTDKYSTRAANAFITVAEKDPAHAYSFMTALYDSKNQPQEATAYRPVSDAKLGEIAKTAGVNPNVAAEFSKHYYVKWVETRTADMNKRKDLFPNGLSTPGVFVGGKDNGASTTGATRVDFTQGPNFTQPLEEALTKN